MAKYDSPKAQAWHLQRMLVAFMYNPKLVDAQTRFELLEAGLLAPEAMEHRLQQPVSGLSYFSNK